MATRVDLPDENAAFNPARPAKSPRAAASIAVGSAAANAGT